MAEVAEQDVGLEEPKVLLDLAEQIAFQDALGGGVRAPLDQAAGKGSAGGCVGRSARAAQPREIGTTRRLYPREVELVEQF